MADSIWEPRYITQDELANGIMFDMVEVEEKPFHLYDQTEWEPYTKIDYDKPLPNLPNELILRIVDLSLRATFQMEAFDARNVVRLAFVNHSVYSTVKATLDAQVRELTEDLEIVQAEKGQTNEENKCLCPGCQRHDKIRDALREIEELSKMFLARFEEVDIEFEKFAQAKAASRIEDEKDKGEGVKGWIYKNLMAPLLAWLQWLIGWT
ncbi:MAG: hypothetical protein Q9162_003378 [Coniocarpon cinnabarinum]